MSEEKGIKNITANDWVNVKDIKGNIIYTKNNYLIGFLKLSFVNIALMDLMELEAKTKNMVATWNGDRKDFVYMSLPRELDLDKYKNFLKEKHTNEIEHLGRRRILSMLIIEGTKLSTSGENYEHLQYVKLWEPIENNIKRAEETLRERLSDYKSRFQLSGSEVEILGEIELTKLCNLFANSNQASYEIVDKNLAYTPITLVG